ncbi:hypothetical protein JST56_04320 [Candidatus Dependentiae bacterium]|jgi:hypothetical protein|nr:hypothetical protein [Candidatus Dependentiae bacterium]
MKNFLAAMFFVMSIGSCSAMQENQAQVVEAAQCVVIDSFNISDYDVGFFYQKMHSVAIPAGKTKETALNDFKQHVWDEVAQGERKILLMIDEDNGYLGHVFFVEQEDGRIRFSSPGFAVDPMLITTVFLSKLKSLNNQVHELITFLHENDIAQFQNLFNYFGFLEDQLAAVPGIGEKYNLDMSGYKWFRLSKETEIKTIPKQKSGW